MTEDWDPELRDLAKEYSPGYVITAFALQSKIDKEGYPGVHFTETTEGYMKKRGVLIIKLKVEKHMNREFRKRDLQ